jgi:tRNA threonylcarbamoyladenosine biosynthesis protein TsaB
MNGRFLILETSCRVGQVALAEGDKVLAYRPLDEARRHARDLTPAVRELLTQAGWAAHSLAGVFASRGPGSYTGLRVGLMSAKAFAYATGCAFLAIDTFAAVAHQAPADVTRLDVLADAQQDRVYLQSFVRAPDGHFQAVSALAIRSFSEWLAALPESCWIGGPGVDGKEDRLRNRSVIPMEHRFPRAESLLHLGLQRFSRGERDDFFTLEPIYLRPSAAELQWKG